MAYRGEDLDLRMPLTRSAGLADATSSAHYTNGLRRAEYGEPVRAILVDEIVLDCCNYAHEIAAAHRAGEVRLEHLVYAMTTIDAVIPALEDRGTRVIALRNEALNLIAGVPQASAKLPPRTSDDLEAVLRFASELAHRREHAAATIEEVLIALIELRPDHPGVVVLRRHMPRRLREPGYQPVRPEAPPLIREPEREPPRLRPAAAPEVLLGTTTDSIQNTRIEALELALRQLSQQLTSERKSMTLSLQDIQRDLGRRREDEVRYGSSVGDRIAAIEVSLDKRLADLGHMINALGMLPQESAGYDGAVVERIAAIEASIEQRLGDLGRAFNSLQDRLQSIDASLGRRLKDIQVSAPQVAIDMAPLEERIGSVERLLQTSTGETSRGWATVADRIKTLEATLAAEDASIVEVRSVASRLEGIENLLLERGLEPAADDGGGLMARLTETETKLGAEVGRIADAVRETSEGLERRMGQLLSGAFERQRAEIGGAIGGAVSERFGVVTSAIERQGTSVVGPVTERIDEVQRSLTTYVQKVSEQATSYDQDLGEIQDVLIKLHGNQQAITASIEQWRQQSATDLGALGSRMSAMEHVTQRPAQLMEAMNTRMDGLYRLVAERTERRNRFIYWLFGTNDWLAASWPERRRAAAPPSVSVR